MAEYQEFGINREGSFMHGTPEEQRIHNFKHACPPAETTAIRNGQPVADTTIVDDMQARYPQSPVVQPGNTVELERKVFAKTFVPLHASVAQRISTRLTAEFGEVVPPEDVSELEMWVVQNEGAIVDAPYPSEGIRVVQDQYVRASIGSRGGPHTIHWHGIEPTCMNDGVGKHSFEINNTFIYQFQPHQAGTFFFHCHKNTVHHFEMGMFGLLIVDPPVNGAPFPTGGAGQVAGRLDVQNGYNPNASNLIAYDEEKIWVADDMDSRWHLDDAAGQTGHSHNMQDCNPADPMARDTFYPFNLAGPGATQAQVNAIFNSRMNLHLFKPDVFAVTGNILDYGATGPNDAVVTTGNPYVGNIETGNIANSLLKPPIDLIRINAQADGRKILIRFLNASYSVVDVRFPYDVTVIAMGGIPLGATEKTQYSRPYVLPKGSALASISARRFEIILDTANLGGAPLIFNDNEPVESQFVHATLTYYDWVKSRPGGKRAIVRIPITIT